MEECGNYQAPYKSLAVRFGVEKQTDMATSKSDNEGETQQRSFKFSWKFAAAGEINKMPLTRFLIDLGEGVGDYHTGNSSEQHESWGKSLEGRIIIPSVADLMLSEDRGQKGVGILGLIGPLANQRVSDQGQRHVASTPSQSDSPSCLVDQRAQLRAIKSRSQVSQPAQEIVTVEKWRKARNKTDDITLDAGTAHPNLSIAGDQKCLKHEAQPQKVPPKPDRFDSTVCVLGSEGFPSGEHYWEVDVVSSTDWDLGVAIKSIQRKGKLSLSPKEGFWALGQSGRDYWAKTDPWTRVMVQKKPKKIGVYFNYQEGQVTFFNVTDMSVLFTFIDCSFSGDIYPFFKNSHKETIMRIS
ncbi:fibroblast growth factor receptor 3 [Platysternon megacephalum]|uniref:Fibroblast growth factor receptor 3 n=1 Tax=Platysternon megacephalum TaxID=55544 RepID=A0A4D9DK15_9SAUR|nr:fibroblast growth factor receptor 3 [Platysternon megacephalum]